MTEPAHQPAEPAQPAQPGQPTKAEQLLATATRLFAERGIGAVPVDMIAAAAGAAVPTLYREYPGGKPELVVRSLGRWSATHLAALRGALAAAAGRGARARLDRLFAFLAGWVAQEGYRGSYVMNAVAELTALAAMDPNAPAAASAVIEQHQQAEHALLAELAPAQAADPDGLADELQLIWYGAIDRARVARPERRAVIAATAKAMAVAMVDQAVAHSSATK